MEEADARSVYFGFYVKRGDTSENRIKEVKNMCFSDKLSRPWFLGKFPAVVHQQFGLRNVFAPERGNKENGF